VDKHFYTMMALWLQLQGKADELGEHLTDRERGQGLVEYSFIIVFVSVACIVALGLLGTNISTLFSKLAECVNTHTVAACVP
jgi:pilus assembly protein Flp/PilA